jgi:hypothetical protein
MASVSKSMDQRPLQQFYSYLKSKGQTGSIGIIEKNIKNYDNPESIKKIKRELIKIEGNGVPLIFKPLAGGKRRCRTMKKHHKRTHKKMRGGYIYSSSKELDKASSVISASSGSKTTSSKSSNSKSKRKDKTRRKSMK